MPILKIGTKICLSVTCQKYTENLIKLLINIKKNCNYSQMINNLDQDNSKKCREKKTYKDVTIKNHIIKIKFSVHLKVE